MIIKQGDIVLNPKNHGDNTCVILRVTSEGKAILSPFTSRGFPSANARNWLSADISKLIKSKKWPKIQTCPECKFAIGYTLTEEDKRILEILDTPLRWLNIYEPRMQCKKCKKWFIKEKE